MAVEFPTIVWSAKNFFGSLTMVSSLAFVFLGLPAQIRKNWRDKKCGQPLSLAFWGFLVLTSRIPYAFTIRAGYLIIPDIVGVVMAGTILFQYFKYNFARNRE